MALKKKKHAICFVDDAQSEIDRFCKYLKDDYIIGAGKTLDKALHDLQSKGIKKPKLFVLDMYFPDGPLNTDEELKELHESREKFLEASNDFAIVLKKLRQSSYGGISLATKVKEKYHRTPFIFFTRKGTLEDCMKGYEFGANSVLKKPEPNRDGTKYGNIIEKAYDKAFEGKVEQVSEAINDAIKRASWWWRNRKTIYGLIVGFFLGVLGNG